MKIKITIGFFVLLLTVAGGYFYFLEQMKADPLPARILHAEQALAMKNAIILGHINVGYAVKLEGKIYGKGAPSPLLNNTKKNPDFINILQENGVDIRQQLTHILSAFYITPDGNEMASLFFGDFDVVNISKSLENAYIIKSKEKDGWITFVNKNKNTCKISEPLSVHLTKNRIIFATPKIMPVIIARLKENKVADIDLLEWTSFREGRIASLGILVPKNSSNALPKGFTRLIVKNMMNKNIPSARSIFIGASVDASLSPSLILDTIINTDDTKWIDEALQKIKTARAKFRQEKSKISPSLSKLDNYLYVNGSERGLSMALNINRQMMNDIGSIAKETVSSFFSFSGFSSSSNKKGVQEKIIKDKNLPKFYDNYTHGHVSSYNPSSQNNLFFKVDSVAGPFAIMLEKAELIEKNNQQVTELTFKIKSDEIRNLPLDSLHRDDADGAAATIFISDVYDIKGRNLIAEEDCGRDRNDEIKGLTVNTGYHFKDGKTISYNYLSGKKTIRLRNGANINDIAGIRGKIKLYLPTGIKVEKLASPLAGKSIEANGVRLFFKKDEKNSLSYEISGHKNQILSVYALNANGRPLNSNGGSASTSKFFNSSRSVNRDIQGVVTGAEITYGTGLTSKTYNFNMTAFLKHYEKETWGKKIVMVKPDIKENFARYASMYNFSSFCKESSGSQALAPFHLCLDDINYMGKSWGANLRFSLAAPQSPALYHNLFGTEIHIDTLKFKKKLGKTSYIKFPMSGFVSLEEANKRSKDRKSLNANSIQINSPDPKGILKKKDIIGAKGKIIIRLPRSFKSRGIYANVLNSHMQTKDKRFVLAISAISYDSITIKAAGDVGKIVQIVPITKDKQPLPLKSVEIEKKDNTYFITLKPVGGIPEFLNIIYTDKQDKFSIPFDIVKGKN